MTTYQRGSRDSLLSYAAECDARAAECSREGDKVSRHRTMGETISRWRYHEAGAWRSAADLARRRAEAVPEDPEVPPVP